MCSTETLQVFTVPWMGMGAIIGILIRCGEKPLALEVEDFDKAIEHLRRHYVTFAVEPFDMTGRRAAIILDPDGNKLGIHKRKA